MSSRLPAAFLILSMLCVPVPARGDATAGAAAPAPVAGAAAPRVPVEWAGMVQGLGSADFPTRQAAQVALDALHADELEKVESLAGESRDAEVQARLLRRAAEMKAYRALHPKAFSFGLNEATLSEVVAAINRDAGQAIVAKPGGLLQAFQGSPRFTLEAKPRSFAELIAELSVQSPCRINPYHRPWTIEQGGGRKYTVAGGFLVEASVSPGFEQKPNGQFGEADWLQLHVTVIPDPRVKVLRSDRTLRGAAVRDDQGTELSGAAQDHAALPTREGLDLAFIDRPVTATMRLGAVHARAEKVAKVMGTLKLEVAVESHRVVLEDIEKKIKEPVPLPTGTLTIMEVKRKEFMNVNARWERKRGGENEGAEGPPRLLFWNVFDTAGSLVAAQADSDSGSSGLSAGRGAAGPLRMEILVPLRTQVVEIPVTLTDIPLTRRRK